MWIECLESCSFFWSVLFAYYYHFSRRWIQSEKRTSKRFFTLYSSFVSIVLFESLYILLPLCEELLNLPTFVFVGMSEILFFQYFLDET